MFNTKNLASRPAKYALMFSALIAVAACDSDDNTTVVDNSGQTDTGQTDTGQQGIDNVQTVSVQLDAAQEIPAPSGVPAGASGTAEISVSENGAVTASLGVSNLSGPATMVHIHRGFAGSTGPVVIGLTSEDGGSTWTVPADARALTTDEIGAFNRGELYFNVHTAANAPGELRGQIDPGNATMFTIRLENISNSDTLNVASSGTTQAVPLSPGAYIVHRNDADSPLLLPRNEANAGLEAVAEDGNPAPYPGAVPGGKL